MENKKASILYILRILKEESDENHFLTQEDISKLVKKEYGVTLERKAVSRSLKLLEELGYDINYNPGKGAALFARQFDESEIQYLVDGIFSSKSISGHEAQKLCEDISSDLSKYQKKDFSYLNKNSDINRTQSKNVFFNINIISEAIKNKKQISFLYLNYDDKGKLFATRDGWRNKGVSPYYLINNFGRYYLIGNSFRYDSIICLRVEFMSDIEIQEYDAKPKVQVLGRNFSISNYINDHVYIFGADVITAEIKIYNDHVIHDLFDWFGKNVTVTKTPESTTAKIKADEKAFFYWCLQYGHDIEVISPDSLRQKVIDELNHMLEKYKTN
jgi:predicted DNA-binding transcriptional regulator YafY